LSAHRLCNKHAAFLSAEADLDAQFFPDWELKSVAGKANTFNIIISEKRGFEQQGCDRKYLSVAAGCGQTYVDLWKQDDGSGRQQWTIRKVPGQEGKYTFTVGGRDNCPRVYLSTRDVWNRVDLWKSRDNDNQWFSIEAGQCKLPEAAPV
jgi:hypothetical protein